MAERYLEREVKLDVDEAFQLPSLTDLVPPGCTLDTTVAHLDSVYFDTLQRDLKYANVTLRRRTGAVAETGWQLKLPIGDERTEVLLPPTPGPGVPKELRDLTAGLRRGRGLRQLARIRTEREVHRLLDSRGATLVEVAEDLVSATTLGGSPVISAWREVEVATGTGEAGLVRAIVKRVRKAGARPALSSSTLARAMADPVASEDRPVGRVAAADWLLARSAPRTACRRPRTTERR